MAERLKEAAVPDLNQNGRFFLMNSGILACENGSPGHLRRAGAVVEVEGDASRS
jgi:hypothetical protein